MERRNRAWFRFRSRPAEDDGAGLRLRVAATTCAAALDRLAYAARATSSFPGAFEPASIGFARRRTAARPRRPASPCRRATTASTASRGRSRRAEAAQGIDRDYVIDGGVLDNIPLAWAVRSIAAAPADCPVDRWLLYLQPIPFAPPPPAQPEPARAPSTRCTGRGELKGGTEALADDLDELERLRRDGMRRRGFQQVLEYALGQVPEGTSAPEFLVQLCQRALHARATYRERAGAMEAGPDPRAVDRPAVRSSAPTRSASPAPPATRCRGRTPACWPCCPTPEPTWCCPRRPGRRRPAVRAGRRRGAGRRAAALPVAPGARPHGLGAARRRAVARRRRAGAQGRAVRGAGRTSSCYVARADRALAAAPAGLPDPPHDPGRAGRAGPVGTPRRRTRAGRRTTGALGPAGRPRAGPGGDGGEAGGRVRTRPRPGRSSAAWCGPPTTPTTRRGRRGPCWPRWSCSPGRCGRIRSPRRPPVRFHMISALNRSPLVPQTGGRATGRRRTSWPATS